MSRVLNQADLMAHLVAEELSLGKEKKWCLPPLPLEKRYPRQGCRTMDSRSRNGHFTEIGKGPPIW